MKKLTLFLLIVCTSSASFAQPKSAEEQIEKYIAAIGGRKVISGIKSQVSKAKMTVMGSELTTTSTLLVGKGYKDEADFNGQVIIQVVTPFSGWTLNPLAGQTDPVPLPEDQHKATKYSLFIGGDIVNYKERGLTMKLDGTEAINGVKAVRVNVKQDNIKNRTLYFDPVTNYLLRDIKELDVNGIEIISYTNYSNYKKTDIGYVMPFSTLINQQFQMTIEITKVEFNKPIDEAIFKMPGN